MEEKKEIIKKIDEEIDYYGASEIGGKRNPLIPTLVRAKLYILESEPIKHGRWVKKTMVSLQNVLIAEYMMILTITATKEG